MCDYLIICDGGSKGNGTEGAVAYGSYLIQVQDKTYGPYRHTFNIGDTNNVAEYKALLKALRHVAAYAPVGSTIEIQSDSQLVIGQVSLGWKVNAAHLRPFVDAAKEMIRDLGGKVTFTKIPEDLMKVILGH